MGGSATSELAIPVTKGGGIGLIGHTFPFSQMTNELSLCYDAFADDSKTRHLDVLPVGVGVLVFLIKVDEVIGALKKARKPPCLIWLFAAGDEEGGALAAYKKWAVALRKEFPSTQIWIQEGGGVAMAVETVEAVEPDVLVVQGTDAGGHGPEVGASLLSAVPEIVSTLQQKGCEVPVVAAGGIVEARGVAAAMTLGAAGVVMGTRFLASMEIKLPHPAYQQRILSAKDGGISTVRAKIFDELKGKNIWPTAYDGRALMSKSYRDWRSGATSEQIVERMKAETDKGDNDDLGFGVESDRAAVWAGTGVGLVSEVKLAKDIVIEVREGAREILKGTSSGL